MTADTVGTVRPGASRPRRWPALGSDRVNIGLVGALVIELIVFTIGSPYFLDVDNLLNIGTAISIVGIVAVGATIIVIAGGFDLSVGATMAASGMVTAYLVNEGAALPVAVGVGLAVGAAVGIANGVIIAYARINALIATLGTLAAVRGLGYVVSGGIELPVNDERYLRIGNADVVGVPVLVWLVLLMFAGFGMIMPRSKFGRYAYAIGSNARASRLAGVPVKRWRVAYYTVGGLLAALGGVLTVARIGTAQPSSSTGAELLVITAVILGGTRLTGGKGTLLGTLLGLVVLGTLNNGLVLLSVPAYWQQVVQGAALLSAVLYDEFRNRTDDE